MSDLTQMKPLVRNCLIAAGVGAGYFACAAIGTVLSVPPSGFAIIWPATAFLISMLLILPPRHWWLSAVGVVPMHYLLAATYQPEAPLVVVTTQIVGNFIVATSTALGVRLAIGTPILFASFRSVFTYILVAAILVPALVHPIVIGAHLATGWADNFWLSWWQWLLSSVFPAATIPPLIVLGWRHALAAWPPAWRVAQLEPVLVFALLFVLTFAAFGSATDASHWPALFLAPLPLLLWAAVRLGVGGTSAALLAVAAGISAQALRSQGPFAAHAPIEGVVSLQVFLITISIPLMLLAALIDERRRGAELLRQSEAWMQLATASTDIGLWQWDVAARRLWITDHCRNMFGLVTASTPEAFLDLVHREDRARVGEAIRAISSGNDRGLEDFRVGTDGDVRWFGLVTHDERDDAGRTVRVSGAFRDISDRIEAQREADRLRQLLLRLQDDEQRRIAEELHDSTAQNLVAANLNLATLKSRAPNRPKGLVEETQRLIGEVTAEIRTFSFLLHPQQLGEDGLSTVLEEYVPGFARRTGIKTRLRVNPVVDALPGEQQHALLRITQESLGNVHRHAGARNAWVSLRSIGGNVHLVVRDDGRGIRPETGRRLGERLRLGVGIPAMNARVRQLGGRIDVSTRRTGTTIHVAIPFTRARSEAA